MTKVLMTIFLSALAMIGASFGVSAAPALGHSDPFTGNMTKYESLLEQAKQAQIEQKLAQSRYEIAHYKARLNGILRQNSPESASRKQIQQLNDRITELSQKVGALGATGTLKHPVTGGTPARVVSVSQPPKLVGIAQTASGRVAWIKFGTSVKQIKRGERIDGWMVNRIAASGVDISYRHHHSKWLGVQSGWSGKLDVNGSVNPQQSTNPGGPVPPAPGSTPASAQLMQSQGAASIASALSTAATSP